MKNQTGVEPGVRLLATASRGGRVESRHHGALALVRDGRLAHAIGDPDQSVFTRSAIKPLQALALLERGVGERYGFTDAELAVISASHNGTPAHVDTVRALLAKGGFDEDHLRCGPHAPFDRSSSAEIARSGGKPARIHNNCSGKHAGFLHLARELGAPPEDYLEPGSPTQALVRDTVAAMAGVAPDDFDVGLDGCGAPTLGMPLRGLATAFWRLANPQGLSDVRAGACRRLLQAISREPVLLAGNGRLCTALVKSAPGRIYPKNGAEGVYALGVVGRDGGGFGMAIKVVDGSERGYIPVVVEALLRLGLWPEVPADLHDFHRIPLRNTQKILVGYVESAMTW